MFGCAKTNTQKYIFKLPVQAPCELRSNPVAHGPKYRSYSSFRGLELVVGNVIGNVYRRTFGSIYVRYGVVGGGGATVVVVIVVGGVGFGVVYRGRSHLNDPLVLRHSYGATQL